MDKSAGWRINRIQIVMSTILIMLYFLYIAACMFATDVMASASPFGETFSWSLFIGALLLFLIVIFSVAYLVLSNRQSASKPDSLESEH